MEMETETEIKMERTFPSKDSFTYGSILARDSPLLIAALCDSGKVSALALSTTRVSLPAGRNRL